MCIWMRRELFAQDLGVLAHFLGVFVIDAIVRVDVVLQHAIQEVRKVEIFEVAQIVAHCSAFASHHPVFVVDALFLLHVAGFLDSLLDPGFHRLIHMRRYLIIWS